MVRFTSIALLFAAVGLCAAADTLKSPDLEHQCLITLFAVLAGESITQTCSAPADGAFGHFCSDAQINKALDLVERDCKPELQGPDNAAQTAYSIWLLYLMHPKTICTKSVDGKYCLAGNKKNKSNPAEYCSGCMIDVIKARASWTSPRPVLTNSKPYIDMMKMIKEDTATCNVTVQSSPSNTQSNSNSAGSNNDANKELKNSNLFIFATSIAAFVAMLAA
ncbi:hypothetical protein BDF19DRAFT_438976 [Syncephalis fuscata]|nr:hypothetical protein BDF19DRAFT_438976 [Syncephalis fuscata]